MRSMLDVEIAVMNEDKEGIQDILESLDRKTENEMFERAAP